MSQKKIYPWIKPLGLSSSNFSEMPKGEDALYWGLKNEIINEQDYLQWASSHYQVPAIKPEFFSMAFDISLVQRFANIYDWNAQCYPVYKWEGMIYVACLHPHEISPKEKFCYVIAPFTALESAWQKYQNTLPGDNTDNLKEGLPQHTPTEALTQTSQEKMELTHREVPVKEEAPTEPKVQVAAPDSVIHLPPPEPETAAETPAPPIPEVIEEVGSLDFSTMDGAGDSPVTEEPEDAQPTPKSEEGIASLNSLDFSTMDGAASESADTTSDTPRNAAEITQTTPDSNLQQFTSATQTMHARPDTSLVENTDIPDLNFDDLSTGGLNLEGDPEASEDREVTVTKAQIETKEQDLSKTPSKNPSPNSISIPTNEQKTPQETTVQPNQTTQSDDLPALDDLVAQQVDEVKPAPGLEKTAQLEIPKKELTTTATLSSIPGDTEEHSVVEESLPKVNEEVIDDDYTPVPVMAENQRQAHDSRKLELEKQEVKNKKLMENTLTDANLPIETPVENTITDQDFAKNSNVDHTADLKGVIAHFFGHLKRDYKKLMWIEKNEAELYFPKYIYGDWKMTSLAWKMHINTSNPNIFRISHKSGQAFHGEVSLNPYNEKYFEWWCRGVVPDFVTLFPVIVEEEIVAFVTCFDKNEEFDEIGSLKKIENLIDICKKAFNRLNITAA